MTPLEMYVKARDEAGLTNAMVAGYSSAAGQPLTQHSLDAWCEGNSEKTAWNTIVRALRTVGIEVVMTPIKGFRPPPPRGRGRPKTKSVRVSDT